MVYKLISVIVPVYKIEEVYLRRAIDSILAQSYKNLEVILIDDGSPDNCGDICDEYGKLDSRVIVKHTENKGVSIARNIGIETSKGDYIIFVDGDDSLNVSMIENLYKAINIRNSDIAMCGCQYVTDSEIIDIKKTFIDFEYKHYLKEDMIDILCYMKKPYESIEITAVWATLFKKEIIKELKFNVHMAIGEDFLFKFEAFSKIKSIVCINSNEYKYLIRQTGAMRSSFNVKKMNSFYIYKNIIEKKNDMLYFNEFLCRTINICFVLLFMIPIRSKEFKNERKIIKEFIIKNRKKVLNNKNIRSKVKIALYSSYLGLDFTQTIFKILSK